METHFYFFIIGGVIILLATLFLYLSRKADRKNYIIQRATPLKIKYVNPRDDVWLDGKTDVISPVTTPHFNIACLHYHYKLEHHERKTRKVNGKTETYYEWVTKRTESDSADFNVDDQTGKILIRGKQAEYDGLESKTQRIGSWRHSIRYLPLASTVGAIGSVSEDKGTLEPYENIPLVVTTKSRENFLKSSETKEAALRWVGRIFLFLGITVCVYGIVILMKGLMPDGSWWSPQYAAISAGIAFVLWLPLMIISYYNMFVQYRNRVRNSWKQIEVDLLARYDLIPNLIQVVKQYSQFEQDVLEDLAGIRSSALKGGIARKVEMESDMVNSLNGLFRTVENYPELKSSALHENVFQQLIALEEKIAHGRKTFNETAEEYNTDISSFPGVLITKIFGFKPWPLFSVEEEVQEIPKIDMKGEKDD